MSTILRALVGLVRRHPWPSLVLVLLAALAVSRLQLRGARAHVRRIGLENVTLEAQLDTTRVLRARELAAVFEMYGRDWLGWTKLVEQGELKSTSLSKSLQMARMLTGRIGIELADLKATVTAPVTSDPADAIRKLGPIDTTIGRYRAVVSAELPRAPLPGRIGLDISQSPIELETELGCHPKNPDGIRPASLVVLARDTTLRLQIGRTQVAADVCNPRPDARRVGVPAWTLPAVSGVTLLACLFLCPDEELDIS